jgi:hypothetical protein
MKFGRVMAIPSFDSWNQTGDLNRYVTEYKKIMGGTDENAKNKKGKHEKEVYIAWVKANPVYGYRSSAVDKDGKAVYEKAR